MNRTRGEYTRRRLLRSGALGALAGVLAQPARGRGRARTRQSVTWSDGPPMPGERTQVAAASLDGRLYVVGGLVEDGVAKSVPVYDPDRERWTTIAPLPERVHHTAAVALRGRLHVVGGYRGPFPGSTPLDSHWVYDPDADEWSEASRLPTPRGALAAGVAGGTLYAVGGATEEGTVARAEAFDPESGEWRRVAAMPTAREHLAAGVADGSLYVAGGRQGFSPMLAATERYDPAADEWESLAAMPTARAGIAGSVLDGNFYVFGGEEVGERVFGAVAAYDPAEDAWTRVEPLPTPRWGLGAATIGDRIFTVGGGTVPSAGYTGTLELLSTTG